MLWLEIEAIYGPADISQSSAVESRAPRRSPDSQVWWMDISASKYCTGWRLYIFQRGQIKQFRWSRWVPWMWPSVSRANYIARRRGSEHIQTLRNTQISRVPVLSTDQRLESSTTPPRATRDQWMKQNGPVESAMRAVYVTYSSVAHCKANYIFSLKCQMCNSVTSGVLRRYSVKCRDSKVVL